VDGIRFGFKPWIRCPDGACRTFENPLSREVGTVAEAARIAEQVARDDYFAPRKPRLEFPYAANSVKLARLVADRRRLGGEPLWHLPEGQAVMRHILSDFHASVRSAGSVPVVLFIPSPETLKQDSAPPYAAVKEEIAREHPDLVVVDVLDAEFERSRFNVLPFQCHASPYGNRVIAEAILAKLREWPPAPRAGSRP
jgi:hypothetical protein